MHGLRRRTISIWFFLLVVPFISTAGSSGLKSGFYTDVTVGINDSQKTISGYYESDGGVDPVTEKPTWSCSFYFSGNVASDGTAKIRATTSIPSENFSETIGGRIKPGSVGATPALIIQLDKYPPGCARGENFVSDSPMAKELEKQGDWIEIRLVASPKAHFYDSAATAKPRRAYVTKGEVVVVLKKDNERTYVEFSNGKKTTSGWLLESDLLAIPH